MFPGAEKRENTIWTLDWEVVETCVDSPCETIVKPARWRLRVVIPIESFARPYMHTKSNQQNRRDNIQYIVSFLGLGHHDPVFEPYALKHKLDPMLSTAQKEARIQEVQAVLSSVDGKVVDQRGLKATEYTNSSTVIQLTSGVSNNE